MLFCFYSYVVRQDDGWTTFQIGMSSTENLVDWSAPLLLTPADRRFNFSSPGNILPMPDGSYILCLQTYPTADNPPGKIFGDQASRLYLMRSRDLIHWESSQLIHAKGDSISEPAMGRMIDPCLMQDPRDRYGYLLFYKQKPENRPDEKKCHRLSG